VESGPVAISPVRRLGSASGHTIPRFHAVLRPVGSVDPGRTVLGAGEPS
jgi:hypothetical protein